jgi:hypothetical protein
MDYDGFNQSCVRAGSKKTTNLSDLADQTINLSAIAPNSIITGRSGFAKRCDTAVMNVLVIEPIKNKI